MINVIKAADTPPGELIQFYSDGVHGKIREFAKLSVNMQRCGCCALCIERSAANKITSAPGRGTF